MKRYYLLDQALIFEVVGVDAERYLHNRLSNDIKALKVGDSLLAAALTPQARVEGLFTVIRFGAQSFYLIADGGEREQVLSGLKRYIVADRVTVSSPLQKLFWVHAIGESSDQFQSLASRPCNRIGEEGVDLLLTALPESEFHPITRDEYTYLRILSGFPQFPDEVNESSIISETGPLEAIKFGKGCYVGQEVVEKIAAIGRAPRRLARVQFDGEPFAEQGPEEEVLSWAVSPSGETTLAYMLLRGALVATGNSVQIRGLSATVL